MHSEIIADAGSTPATSTITVFDKSIVMMGVPGFDVVAGDC
jgi:hypothetical protein